MVFYFIQTFYKTIKKIGFEIFIFFIFSLYYLEKLII